MKILDRCRYISQYVLNQFFWSKISKQTSILMTNQEMDLQNSQIWFHRMEVRWRGHSLQSRLYLQGKFETRGSRFGHIQFPKIFIWPPKCFAHATALKYQKLCDFHFSVILLVTEINVLIFTSLFWGLEKTISVQILDYFLKLFFRFNWFTNDTLSGTKIYAFINRKSEPWFEVTLKTFWWILHAARG